MTLSVVVPATDARPTLERCLAAISTAEDAPEEVIVVDDPSIPTSAAARNAGAARAQGEIFVFVDSDVVVARDAFTRIREAFEEPTLDALIGSYDDHLSDLGTVAAFRNLLHHHVHSTNRGDATTFWTGLGAVRRSVFRELGGFDVSNPWIRDIEFGMRLSASGRRIVLDPAIRGMHLKRWTLREMVVTDFRRRGVPWVRLLLGAGHGSTSLNLGWRHRLSALSSVALVVGGATRAPRLAVVSGISLVALNASFYRLLFRRTGAKGLAAGIPLHALHHLISVAALPVGVAEHLADVARGGSGAERSPAGSDG